MRKSRSRLRPINTPFVAGLAFSLAGLASAASADQNVTPTAYQFEVEVALCTTASCSLAVPLGATQLYDLGSDEVLPFQPAAPYGTFDSLSLPLDFTSFTHIQIKLANNFKITAAATTELDSDGDLCVTGDVADPSDIIDGISLVFATGVAAISQNFVISTNAAAFVDELTVDVNDATFIFAFAAIPGFGAVEVIVPPAPNLGIFFDVGNTMEFEGAGAIPAPPGGQCRALFSTPSITVQSQ